MLLRLLLLVINTGAFKLVGRLSGIGNNNNKFYDVFIDLMYRIV